MNETMEQSRQSERGSSELRVRATLSDDEREKGYAECYEVLREHGKTFHVMAKLLGRERGRAIAAIYRFARTSDDIVDAPDAGTRPEEIRAELLHMKAELRRAIAGESRDRKFAVLGETLNTYGVELYPFDDLVAGVEMDLSKTRYADYAELELYCYRVAGTIGLMITPVAGFQRGTRALQYAKTLGTAFQLTNILRDVGDDLKRGRIYLPKEDLDRFGITEQDLLSGRNDTVFKSLMEFEIERALRLYREGLALIPYVTSVGGRLAFQFAVDAYSAILMKIRANGYDVYSKRAHLTFWEKIMMIPMSWWRSDQAQYKAIGTSR